MTELLMCLVAHLGSLSLLTLQARTLVKPCSVPCRITMCGCCRWPFIGNSQKCFPLLLLMGVPEAASGPLWVMESLGPEPARLFNILRHGFQGNQVVWKVVNAPRDLRPGLGEELDITPTRGRNRCVLASRQKPGSERACPLEPGARQGSAQRTTLRPGPEGVVESEGW